MYIELSEELKKNNSIKNIIFISYIYLIINYEIVDLLRFIDESKKYCLEDLSSTPKNKECGEMFIYYLFGHYKIKKINLNQAIIINKIENWDNLEILRRIFKQFIYKIC